MSDQQNDPVSAVQLCYSNALPKNEQAGGRPVDIRHPPERNP